jgi:alpha-tubulin suppressor-like RCC1 family protein
MTQKGVWDLQQVRDEYLQGNWNYVDANGLYVWGSNQYGQLGLNDSIPFSSPIQVPGAGWNSIGVSIDTTYHLLAIKDDGTLWAWGRNNFGQLGTNSQILQSSPVQIPGTQWSVIRLGDNFTSALKNDGTLWSWGSNQQGRLGHNQTTTYYSSPRQIPGTQSSTIFSSGYRGFLALKTDGTLWSWGANYSGQLGQGNTVHYSSPVQIPGTNWNNPRSIQRTRNTCYLVTENGSLWAWGYNDYGELGLVNNKTARSSPTQVPGTQWSNVSGAGFGANGVKTDGTLWAWGYNITGRLGLNDAVNRSSPTQIPGTQWSSVGRSYDSGIAFKSDGSLWGWGAASFGRLGQNDTINRSSPIQIPGPWTSAIIFSDNMAAIQ